jgi:predicted transcriptional regulator
LYPVQDAKVKSYLEQFVPIGKSLDKAPQLEIKLDEFGRSFTMASRKTARGQIWMEDLNTKNAITKLTQIMSDENIGYKIAAIVMMVSIVLGVIIVKYVSNLNKKKHEGKKSISTYNAEEMTSYDFQETPKYIESIGHDEKSEPSPTYAVKL